MCARRYGECSLLECARLTDRAPCVRSALPGRKRGEKRSEAKEDRSGSGSIFRIHIMGQRRSQSLQYLSNVRNPDVIQRWEVLASLMTRSLELRGSSRGLVRVGWRLRAATVQPPRVLTARSRRQRGENESPTSHSLTSPARHHAAHGCQCWARSACYAPLCANCHLQAASKGRVVGARCTPVADMDGRKRIHLSQGSAIRRTLLSWLIQASGDLHASGAAASKAEPGAACTVARAPAREAALWSARCERARRGQPGPPSSHLLLGRRAGLLLL